jgi:hypothetical protein
MALDASVERDGSLSHGLLEKNGLLQAGFWKKIFRP